MTIMMQRQLNQQETSSRGRDHRVGQSPLPAPPPVNTVNTVHHVQIVDNSLPTSTSNDGVCVVSSRCFDEQGYKLLNTINIIDLLLYLY